MAEMVTSAIAQEEALERVDKVFRRRQLADSDYRTRRAEIDLKLGAAIKAAFGVGLTAKQISRKTGLSIPRIYQIRNAYMDYLNSEFPT